MSSVQGVFICEFKYELYWLKDIEKNTQEAFNLNNFTLLLRSCFIQTQVKKIIDELTSYKRLIIDFSLKKVKIIEEKEQPFLKDFIKYFKPENIEIYLAEGNEEEDLYNTNKEGDIF